MRILGSSAALSCNLAVRHITRHGAGGKDLDLEWFQTTCSAFTLVCRSDSLTDFQYVKKSSFTLIRIFPFRQSLAKLITLYGRPAVRESTRRQMSSNLVSYKPHVQQVDRIALSKCSVQFTVALLSPDCQKQALML